jgi:hypothetical protein
MHAFGSGGEENGCMGRKGEINFPQATSPAWGRCDTNNNGNFSLAQRPRPTHKACERRCWEENITKKTILQ